VVGDEVYGGRRERRGAAGVPPAPRQLLHAWRLGFHHPARGEWLEFAAPIPADFATAATLDLADLSSPVPDRRSLF
jgi:23S rRNA pseudouridine1911/1915/1917 synthase